MIRRMFNRLLGRLGLGQSSKPHHPPAAGGSHRSASGGHGAHPYLPSDTFKAAPAKGGDHHRPARPPREGAAGGRRQGAQGERDGQRRPASAKPHAAGSSAPAEGARRPREGAPAERGDRPPRPRQERRPRRGAPEAAGEALPDTVVCQTPHTPWDPAISDQVPPAEGKTRFADLGLRQELLHAISDLGFKYCTPIQALALPHSLKNENVAGKAQTGTGKTAAFLLAVFQRYLEHADETPRAAGTPRTLILAPTRELVVQIQKDAAALGKYCPFRCVAVYGGMGYDQQERQLAKGVDVLAATPGRLIDFIRKGTVDLRRVDMLVIDEADRMLDMGFIPDVRRIISRTPPNDKRQTMLFSATLAPEIMRLASQWMEKPVTVEVEPEHIESATVEQVVYSCTSQEKAPLLLNLLQDPKMNKVIVFANRRDVTTRLTERLQRFGIDCDMLSGEVAQNKRMRILEDFRAGKLRVLVATDVAGRGLHISGVTHVVNYDVPTEPQDYVHRIGRTGRAGAVGNAITFACERESFTLPEIEALLGHDLVCRQPDEAMVRMPHRPAGPANRPDGGETTAA